MHHCVPKLDKVEQLFSEYKQRMEKLRTFRREKEAANNQMGKISFEKYYRLEEIKWEFCEHVDGFFEFAKVHSE